MRIKQFAVPACRAAATVLLVILSAAPLLAVEAAAPQRAVHRRRRPEPLGRLPGPQPADDHAEHRSPGGPRRHVHARLLRRAGLQSLARRADVRPAAAPDRRLRQQQRLAARHPARADADHHLPQGRLLRRRRRQDLPRRLRSARASGTTIWKREGREPKPTGDTGVGGIKFAPLDCQDEDLREWKIVSTASTN